MNAMFVHSIMHRSEDSQHEDQDHIEETETDLRTVTCRAKQSHIKRRQDYDPSQGEGGDKKRQKGEMGNLSNFPGITEEMFLAYSSPVPEEREHRTPMPGIENSGYPEQLISLPNPNLLEPLVTM